MKNLNQTTQTIQQRLKHGAKDAQQPTTSLNELAITTPNGQQAQPTEVGPLNKQVMNLNAFGTITHRNNLQQKQTGLTLGQGGNLITHNQAKTAMEAVTQSLTHSAMQCVMHYTNIKAYNTQAPHNYYLLESDTQSLQGAAQVIQLILNPLKSETQENENKFIRELTGFLATQKFALSHNAEIQASQISRWTKKLKNYPLWAIFTAFDMFESKFQETQPTPGKIESLLTPLLIPFNNTFWDIQGVLKNQKTFQTNEEMEAYAKKQRDELNLKKAKEAEQILQKQETILKKLAEKEEQRIQQQNEELAKKQEERRQTCKRLATVQKIIDEQSRFNGLVKEADALIQKIQQATECANNLSALESKLLNS